MADYYPLLSRAVAALPAGNPEARQLVYDRARQALAAQLRGIEPPIAEALIQREQGALEEVIRRIELEVATAGEPAAPPPGPEPLPATADPPPGEAAPTSGEPPPFIVKRPKVPERARSQPRKPWLALVVGVGVAVVVGVAVLAITLRDTPSEPIQPRREAGTTAPAAAPPGGAKIGERVGGERVGAEGSPGQQEAQQQGQAAEPRGPGPLLPIAHRVFMLEEVGTPEQPQVQTRQGSVIWRVDTESAQGQALRPIIRASMDVAEGQTRADMVIRRNVDPSFAASHTIELVFTQLPGNSAGAVKELDQIEMRVADTTPGTPLAGLGIPVQDNVFLVGLSASEPSLSRNIDLLRNRGWMFFRVRFANNRLGAFLIEKGATGNKVFEDAFRSW
jgi:hypothetical protein